MKNKKLLKRIFDIVFWVAIVGFVAFKFGYQRMAPSVDFKELVLLDEQGNEHRLAEFENKNILINFYQSWCGPCMGEMGSLSNAYEQMKNEGFVYIALSDESFDLIKKVKSRGDNQMLFYKTKHSLDDIGIRVYPTTYLLNKKGEVVFEKVNVEAWDSPIILDEFKQLTKN